MFIPTPSIILLLMQAYCKYLCHNGELCNSLNSLMKLYAASCARGTPCKFFVPLSHCVRLCGQTGVSPFATGSCSPRDQLFTYKVRPWQLRRRLQMSLARRKGGWGVGEGSCLICRPRQKISFFLFIPLFFFFFFWKMSQLPDFFERSPF